MGCRPAPAVRKMLTEATERWPHRDRASDGACADARHKALKSDHNADAEGFATAADIDHDPDGGFDAAYWAEQLRERRDPRVKYVIYRGRMFSSYGTSSRRAWAWGAYTGSNAHLKHMHVSVLPEWKYDEGDWWFTEEADLPLTPQEKDEIVARVVEGVGWKLVEQHQRLTEPALQRLSETVHAKGDFVAKRAVEMRDSLKGLISKELAAVRGSIDSLKK